jgi:hypothetical protein
MFTAAGEGGYVAEKAEGQTGWLFPVGDEVNELGYVHMFQDMLDAWEAGHEPMETFRDGYVVNAIIDACYKSMKTGHWEPVRLEDRGGGKKGWAATGKGPKKASGRPQEGKTGEKQGQAQGKAGKVGFIAIKEERLPDGRVKRILKDKATGRIIEKID